MRHTRKRWVSLIIGPLSLLLVIGLFGVTTPVRADDQVTTAQNALQENQNQTTTLQAQIQAQEDKITEINNQIGNKTLALEKNEKQIQASQTKINKLNQKIKTTKTDVKARKKAMQKRLRALQKQSEKSALGNVYADFVLSGSDFSEMLSRALAVKKISASNKTAIKVLQATQQDLTDLKTTKTAQQTKLVAAKADLETQQAQLNDTKAKASEAQTQLTAQLSENQGATADLEAQLKTAQDNQAAIEAATKAEQERQDQLAATSTNAMGTSDVSASIADNTTYKQAIAEVLSDSAANNRIIQDALQYLGVPYVWGGTTPSGFDCSGLIYYCYKLEGRTIPRVSQGQSTQGKYVAIGDLQPGDLVFWGGVGTAHHVALYIGNGQYIHAPQPGQTVKIGSIAYYRPDFGRRL